MVVDAWTDGWARGALVEEGPREGKARKGKEKIRKQSARTASGGVSLSSLTRSQRDSMTG